MLISVVVPAHNAVATLDRCLAAVRASDRFEAICDRIIVVDDGSTDDTGAVAARYGADVIRLETAHGPAAARNRGVAAAAAEVVLFLDADVVVHPDTLARVAAHFRAPGGPDAVMGSYDDNPASRTVVSRYRILLHHFVHQSADEEARSFWAGCGAVRRQAFVAVDGFDVSFSVPSIEDIELGYRLTDAGYRIRLDKDVQVTHLKRWTLVGMVVTDVTRRALPWARLLLSRRSLPPDLNLRYRHRVSVALALLLAATAALAAASFVVGSGSLAGGALAGAGSAAVLLLALNLRLYAFFARRGGVWFAICATALHWLYYVYSGLALIWVLLTPRARGHDGGP